ncbi:hypothetical protein [Helicobacter burdigaliensis]|nr:hypothetical protein [Helicobacter burdigaliensis]
MKKAKQNITKKNSEEYLSEKEAIKKTREKMKKELKKPEIRAVFERLRDK